MSETPNLDRLITDHGVLCLDDDVLEVERSAARAELAALRAENALLAKKAALADEAATWISHAQHGNSKANDWIARWEALNR